MGRYFVHVLSILSVFFYVLAVVPCYSRTQQSFLVEPWYKSLQQFGPLAKSGWEARPMTLIADYTWRIERLEAVANDEFIFVAELDLFNPPPLGPLNWKQGKIGVGKYLSLGTRSATLQLIPGGGSGRYPVSGIFNMTLYTSKHPTKPNTIELTWNVPSPISKIDLMSGAVIQQPLQKIRIMFSQNVTFAAEQIVVENGKLSPFDNRSYDAVRGFYFWESVVAARVPDVPVRIYIPPNITLPYGNAPTESRFIYPSEVLEGKWGPVFTLRDPVSLPSDPEMPLGGWYAAPIHANYIPSLRKVLLTGWIRRDHFPCAGGYGPGGRRRAGVTWLVDPTQLRCDDPVATACDLDISPIDEDPEVSFANPGGATEDGYKLDGDVMYCSGHTTLPDGRVFFIGGGRYSNISQATEREWGLDYGRLFDPQSGRLRMVPWKMPLGRSWYPTAGRLSDGRILVTGAYTDYATDKCLGDSCLNPQINVFDVNEYDQGNNPWSVHIDAAHGDHDIDPGIREYTRVFVLPKPIVAEGLERQVLLMGKAGKIILYNTDKDTPVEQRMFKPPGGQRVAAAGRGCSNSDQSTAFPLLTPPHGEFVVIGGCPGRTNSMQSIDIYNVERDEWQSLELGIGRAVSASILLPDGRVMILSGEDPNLDQNALIDNDSTLNPRHVQYFDPSTRKVYFEKAPTTIFRGYHNMVALLYDGSVVTGGGINQFGDVGCENPNIQLFRPAYLNGMRPEFDFPEEELRWYAGQREITLNVKGEPTTRVSLMAVTAFTHSYDQNQRFIALEIIRISSTNVTINLPEFPVVFSGHYQLFLVSATGTPSYSKHVIISNSPNST